MAYGSALSKALPRGRKCRLVVKLPSPVYMTGRSILQRYLLMNPSVLVIDDDAELRDMLKLVLEFEGFQVYSAADGSEGMKTLDRFPDIQAILLDLMMPVMNGFQFLEKLEKRGKPPIPVIVLTAAERSLLKHPILKRVRKIAQKPFKVEELIFMLKEMMKPVPRARAAER